MFIYKNESGNDPARVNPYGCIGLGQACPDGAKSALLAACPSWATDYACQDRFWDGYAQRRYKGWQAAKDHWVARVPIGGRDLGHWW